VQRRIRYCQVIPKKELAELATKKGKNN